MPEQTSPRQLRSEVAETRAVLTGILGKTSNLFRPPQGKLTAAKLWGLWRQHQTVVLWNRSPSDGAGMPTADLRRWFVDNPLHGGDVVLLHDDQPNTVAPGRARCASAWCRAAVTGLRSTEAALTAALSMIRLITMAPVSGATGTGSAATCAIL